RVGHERAAGPALEDFGDGAAHVDVDDVGPVLLGHHGGARHGIGIAAEDLHGEGALRLLVASKVAERAGGGADEPLGGDQLGRAEAGAIAERQTTEGHLADTGHGRQDPLALQLDRSDSHAPTLPTRADHLAISRQPGACLLDCRPSTMARLHLIIEKLHSSGASDLVFETGTPGHFRFPQGKRPVYREPLSTEQIIGLFAEVVPAAAWRRLDVEGTIRLPIDVPSGPVEVVLARRPDGLTAIVRPRPAGEARTEATQAAEPQAAATEGGERRVVEIEKPAATLSDEPAEAMAQLLDFMVERRASDLHLVAGSPPIFRIDGDLVPAEDLPSLDAERLRAMLWSIAPDRNRDEWTARHDTDFAHETPKARFRVNVFANRLGIAAVLRQIPNQIRTAEELGLPQALLDLCFLTKGLVLVTGPTGSGKSTTLAALIDYINRNRSDHILTIEDPIEFVHRNKKCLVNQREVGVHTESFKRALRAALREDPDIILVG